MTAMDRFDDLVAEWLIGAGPADIRPSVVDEAIALAARRPQLRAWQIDWWKGALSPASRRAIRLGIAVALVAAMIGAAVLVIGRPQPLPRPLSLVTRTAPQEAAYGLPIALADGRVLLIGEQDGAGSAIFDPASGTIIATGRQNEARGVGRVAIRLLDGRVLVAGGFAAAEGESRYLITAELYDPASGTWRPTGSLASTHVNCCMERGLDVNPVREARAILLNDGRVLITGGDSAFADLFDPANESFEAVRIGCMPLGDMVLLRDGRALVTCISSQSTEIALFDPASSAFTAGAHPPLSSGAHLAALPDGRVLFAGWVLQAEQGAQLYDPMSDSFTVLATSSNPQGSGWDFALEDGRVLFLPRHGLAATVFDPSTLRFETTDLVVPASIARVAGLAGGEIFGQGNDDLGDYAWVLELDPPVIQPDPGS